MIRSDLPKPSDPYQHSGWTPRRQQVHDRLAGKAPPLAGLYASAVELAALYHQRWEFETTLDELKTHQRGPKVVLRSRSPEMVAQEVWGMLLVHHAIRRLMHQAALDHHLDPDRLPFVRSLRIVRRQVTTTGQAVLPP
jgi:hypothetical protein